MVQIIDGRKISHEILQNLKRQIQNLSFVPVFSDVFVGQNPVSRQYVELKAKVAEQIGLKFIRADFPESILTEQLIFEIQKLNAYPNLCGLIVQLPLPAHINRSLVLNAVDPKVDVDCTGEFNSNNFYSGKGFFTFPTAGAILEIFKREKIDLTGKKIVIVGRGALVGRPVEFLLKQKGLQPICLDKSSQDLKLQVQQADILVSAAGIPKLIFGSDLKKDSIVIDAGTSEIESGIVGDVDFTRANLVVSKISPVPGGVGPVTVAKLFENVLKVAVNRLQS